MRRGALTFILARGIGQSFVAREIEAAPVRAFLEAQLRGDYVDRMEDINVNVSPWLALVIVIFCLGSLGLLLRRGDGADGSIPRAHACAAGSGRQTRPAS